MKKNFEPWNKEEKEIMQMSLDQTQLKIDTNEAEILKIDSGLKGIEDEIQSNVDSARANVGQAKLKLKAAEMSLADIEFHAKHKITQKRLKCKVAELKQENNRNQKNLKAFHQQLKEGKPKVETQMSEEPLVEETPEEKESNFSWESIKKYLIENCRKYFEQKS